ncbi:SIMPL domain-containing protein [Neorhizobium galegae]|uniref:SIMPL domain-containing protein n=1 Tax=Neorhizobium galegae TaxID=399 RepID=UPI0006226411|nr:SIMPL domain-containing protein [Neorhizobium galegae]CDZ25392.1 Periplasmic immunogenic protein [Neorhizobium galegae bv. officinalis]KAA9387750.1 SIMPL domain-containing protein [Neorhizobium galegae]KAB1115780.1 SIMPL domain-containing protein [Neorhizobium galegae]MCM2498335.1 SIMPL domain-containing protein [Neorhizobium galegae]MCQ1774304.1 SIMPL domain-containing protein [Neorhizobium galegae]
MRVALSSSRLVLAAAFAGAAAVSSAGQVLAQDIRPREPVINVLGEGQASVPPDMAVVTLSVVRNGQTAEAALSASSAAMREVLAAVKSDGIADRDVQTSNFSIYPQYRHPEPKGGVIDPPQVIGYEVSNTLTLKVRDLQKLGGLIDRSVKLGVNQGGQITFTNDKPDDVMTEARKKAVAEALAKARTLTEAAGVKLGRILEISENSMRPAPQQMMRMAMAKDMAAEAVPVAGGENTYTVTVNVTFALEQ